MKRGIWGSGLDRFLNRLRDVIREHGNAGFPVPQIEEAMTSLGKSLTFQPAEVDELLDLTFGSPRIFPVLAMLYPGVDLSKSFHEDHIFPRSRFTRSKLLSTGIAPDQIDEYLDKVNRLPNLQLLPGIQNTEKLRSYPRNGWPARTSQASRSVANTNSTTTSISSATFAASWSFMPPDETAWLTDCGKRWV
jgi:hypothetical protein